jgi:hypothetical protein
MELMDYQAAAAATAAPEAFSLDYLIPGIVGEVGELFGQKAKAHWHGWTPERLQAELISEYWDICWMTAILLSTENVHHLTYKQDRMEEFVLTRWGNKRDSWHILLQRAQYLHQWSTEKETLSYIRGEAQQMWVALHQYCWDITGASFDHVLNANLMKLAGRVQRGTLVGQGDHR